MRKFNSSTLRVLFWRPTRTKRTAGIASGRMSSSSSSGRRTRRAQLATRTRAINGFRIRRIDRVDLRRLIGGGASSIFRRFFTNLAVGTRTYFRYSVLGTRCSMRALNLTRVVQSPSLGSYRGAVPSLRRPPDKASNRVLFSSPLLSFPFLSPRLSRAPNRYSHPAIRNAFACLGYATDPRKIIGFVSS